MDDNLSQILQRAYHQALEKPGAVCVAASIKKPIHNVKEAGRSRKVHRPKAEKIVSSSLE